MMQQLSWELVIMTLSLCTLGEGISGLDGVDYELMNFSWLRTSPLCNDMLQSPEQVSSLLLREGQRHHGELRITAR